VRCDEFYDHARRVTIASVFVDDKVPQRTRSWPARLFANVYKPVARWRFRTQNFGVMPERHLYDLIL
jgi:hypothetical protein